MFAVKVGTAACKTCFNAVSSESPFRRNLRPVSTIKGPWKATSDKKRWKKWLALPSDLLHKGAKSGSSAAMCEYHKPPKQVSNHWTPRLAAQRLICSRVMMLATAKLQNQGHRNHAFPRPPRTNGTVRAAPLPVPALLAAASACDGRRVQLTHIRRKAGRCAARSAASRRRRDPRAPDPTLRPPARENHHLCRRKSPS